MQTTRVTIDLSTVEYASFPQRIAARIIDLLIVAALFVAFVYLAGREFVIDEKNMDPTLGVGNLLWFAPLFSLAYEVPTMASRGLTLGKRICGICVVRTDGLIGIGLDRALIRFGVPQGLSFIPAIGPLLNIAALCWCFFDPNRQNIPDKAAKTFVIRIPKNGHVMAGVPDIETEAQIIETKELDE